MLVMMAEKIKTYWETRLKNTSSRNPRKTATHKERRDAQRQTFRKRKIKLRVDD